MQALSKPNQLGISSYFGLKRILISHVYCMERNLERHPKRYYRMRH
jgi:hypothetical protein